MTLADLRDTDILPFATKGLGDPEATELREQAKRGELSGLRAYLARTRAERDWQDREFMLDLVVSSFRPQILNFACDAEPTAPDLFLIRCAFYSNLASTMRGSRTADKVSEQQFRGAADTIKAAIADLETAVRLDPDDPTADSCILPSLTIFSQLWQFQQQSFQRATQLSPDLVIANRAITNALSKRWCGSHEQSLAFARHAVAKAPTGSDMAYCLFWAHKLVQSHPIYFENNPKAAAEYLLNPAVRQELAAAFDAWVAPPYVSRRSSVPHLNSAAHWFFLVGDIPRLRQALYLVGDVFCKGPWKDRAEYRRAVRLANGEDPNAIHASDCLDTLVQCDEAINGGKWEKAADFAATALTMASKVPIDDARHLVPLVALHNSFIAQLLKRSDPRKTREQALLQLDRNETSYESAEYSRLMAKILMRLKEYQRAIPFWHKALRLSKTAPDALERGVMLHELGQCHHYLGRRDESIEPLRAAHAIYAAYRDDPLYPAVLVNLGNALRKTSAGEAETLYREAAERFFALDNLVSAGSAWLNVGVLHSEHGRNPIARKHYERALAIYRQAPKPPPAKIAVALANIAECDRRSGDFREAHKMIDQALKLYPANDVKIAHGYTTRGEIYLDSGDASRAVEWFRKSTAELRKQPAPNLEKIATNTEKEIAALERLNKPRDLAAAQQALASVRATLNTPLHQAS